MLKHGQYIADMAFDIGLHDMTWQAIQAWCQIKDTSLTPWESNAIMAISRAYKASISENRDKATPAPYQPGVIDREKVAADVRAALRRRR